MARLGDYIQEECHMVGAHADKYELVGVSNEHGLVPSPRAAASDNLSRYQKVERNWFAYNPMRVNVGSIGLADDASKTGITSPDYVVFSCREGILPRFVLHFLKSDYGLEAISRNCSGAVRKRLYFSGLADIQLHVPSLARQQVIVEKIDRVQSSIRFIRDHNSTQHELPQIRQAIFQEAVSGNLTASWRSQHRDIEPASQLVLNVEREKRRLVTEGLLREPKPLPAIQAADQPFQLPQTWQWCRLGSITRFFDYRGRTPIKSKTGVRLITAKNVRPGRFLDEPQDFLSEAEFARHMVRGFPETGDILFTTEAPLGNACQLEFKERFALGQRLITIQPLLCDKKFMLYAMLSRMVQKQLLEKASGITAKGIKSSRLTHVLIPVPPLDEQRFIVSRVDELLAKCRVLQEQIDEVRQLGVELVQAVLNEAFSGATVETTGVHARTAPIVRSTGQPNQAA
jgi:type I restriction enzyme S subunit